MENVEVEYWKWSLWYSGNKPQYATMDDMLKDAFFAGWHAAQQRTAEDDEQFCMVCTCPSCKASGLLELFDPRPEPTTKPENRDPSPTPR